MGSVFNRGTRDNPAWYGKYKDADGKWKMVPTKQQTKIAARRFIEAIEGRIANGKGGVEKPVEAPLCSELFDKWTPTLTNRNAYDDKSRTNNHLKPYWGQRRVDEVTLRNVIDWLDYMKAKNEIASGTQRGCLNLLSRFCSWAIEKGHMQMNPVRNIPTGRRPRQAKKTDTPWLDDDALVRTIMNRMKQPVNLMFYLCNRAGLRLGESCGLRMSDLDFVDEGVIRARFSYTGPLKEDKYGDGDPKWGPCPDDFHAVMDEWLALRRAQGAQPEDFVFPNAARKQGCYEKQFLQKAWNRAVQRGAKAKKKGLKPLVDMTFYQATRHSATSRNLKNGESLDEVSAALNHSSPNVTKRYYDHYVRKTFSAGMRRGLGFTKPDGGTTAGVIEMPKRRGVG